ncbi:hypothetical protein EK21DRAFT_90730 [Setomelanomma holmii]|uniref:Uncharacterized protein n=1 Tax=Setomelanomma holmii TaxID=210430 RepID=A0A9P4LL50_9PLEO|nr:hypothetical protein EK21DRAFT_90730 [Setomelanomma holmii]
MHQSRGQGSATTNLPCSEFGAHWVVVSREAETWGAEGARRRVSQQDKRGTDEAGRSNGPHSYAVKPHARSMVAWVYPCQAGAECRIYSSGEPAWVIEGLITTGECECPRLVDWSDTCLNASRPRELSESVARAPAATPFALYPSCCHSQGARQDLQVSSRERGRRWLAGTLVHPTSKIGRSANQARTPVNAGAAISTSCTNAARSLSMWQSLCMWTVINGPLKPNPEARLPRRVRRHQVLQYETNTAIHVCSMGTCQELAMRLGNTRRRLPSAVPWDAIETYAAMTDHASVSRRSKTMPKSNVLVRRGGMKQFQV